MPCLKSVHCKVIIYIDVYCLAYSIWKFYMGKYTKRQIFILLGKLVVQLRKIFLKRVKSQQKFTPGQSMVLSLLRASIWTQILKIKTINELKCGSSRPLLMDTDWNLVVQDHYWTRIRKIQDRDQCQWLFFSPGRNGSICSDSLS